LYKETNICKRDFDSWYCYCFWNKTKLKKKMKRNKHL